MSDHDLPFGPRLIGQTEKTLNAILDHFLAGSGVTETEWVALVVTAQGGAVPEAEAAERVAGALKRTRAEGAAMLGSLAARGLVQTDGGRLAVTDRGRELQEDIQGRTAAVGDRLWGGIAPADRQAAAGVLNRVLERAAAELAALRREPAQG